MKNTLLVDADVLCYQFAYRNTDRWSWDSDDEIEERLQPEKALAEIDEFVEDLRDRLLGDKVYFILSCPKANFRKSLDPTYKASRKGKPTLWRLLRDYIEIGDHGYPVRMIHRLEGDDVLGIMATTPTRGKGSVIVSIDKDMLTVPARINLYNRDQKKIIHQTEFDAQRFHLTQVLTGDAVDEYKGVPGIGPKKAEAIAEQCPTNREYWRAILATYKANGMTKKDALLQARLAHILQYGSMTIGGKIRLWQPTKITT